MAAAAKQAGGLFRTAELPEKAFECPEHGAYTGKPFQFTIGGKDRVIVPECPSCLSEKAETEDRNERERRKRREGAFEDERVNGLRKMNIGRKFWDESFDTFNAYTPELERYLNVCIGFANTNEGRMLVMLGNHGNGKNHLAASILKKLVGICIRCLKSNCF